MQEEKSLEGHILDDLKFPSKLLASTMHQSSLNLQSKLIIEKHSQVQKLVLLWSLATLNLLIRTVETYVVHEYRADTFLRTFRKGRRGS